MASGTYNYEIQVRRNGRWQSAGSTFDASRAAAQARDIKQKQAVSDAYGDGVKVVRKRRYA